MKEIDSKTWDRKAHFDFFLRSDLPFYNVDFNLDVTGLRDGCKERGVSVNSALIYATVRALNRVENFLYRLENGKVVRYDGIDPSFTSIREGEELFRLITVNFHDDIVVFDQTVKAAVAASTAYFDVSMLTGRSNFVFISALPWIPFTGIDHTQSLNKEDAMPRVSWGKMHERNGKTVLPYNIRVNHIFIDGIHVGRFYECLTEEIRRLVKHAG